MLLGGSTEKEEGESGACFRSLLEGVVNIFRKGGCGSVVDLIFVRPALTRVMSWWVSEHYRHSDNQAIFFELCVEPRGQRTIVPKTKKDFGLVCTSFG